MSRRFVTWAQVRKLIPLSRQHVARLEHAGKFPRRINISERRVAWDLDELNAWLASRGRGPIKRVWLNRQAR
jgi:prophage regulatory protein